MHTHVHTSVTHGGPNTGRRTWGPFTHENTTQPEKAQDAATHMNLEDMMLKAARRQTTSPVRCDVSGAPGVGNADARRAAGGSRGGRCGVSPLTGTQLPSGEEAKFRRWLVGALAQNDECIQQTDVCT